MRYFLGTLAVVIVGILAIILITSRPASTNQPNVNGQKQITLTDYANTDADVRLTIDGRINGRDEHRAIRITVNQHQRTIEILKGYSSEVDRSQQFGNDQAAYNVFLHALQTAGYANAVKNPKQKDETGICPLGQRYSYEVLNATEQVVDLWSTSCLNSQGTFAGDASLVRQLFQAQIPGYGNYTGSVQL